MQTGKTILRIEERPTDPEYRYARDDTLLIHFTDGTALEITGQSYEAVSLDYKEIDRRDMAARTRAAQGRREKERLARLKQSAWNALTPEEQAEKNAARRAKMSPFARVVEDEIKAAFTSTVLDMNRGFFSGTIPAGLKKARARRS